MNPKPASDRLFLAHILECIANIENDIHGQPRQLFENRTIRDAVLRNLQILAESTQRLSDEAKQGHPEIPWKQIEGFRHRLVHDYFRIDLNLVQRVVEQHLPDLKRVVAEMLDRLDQS